jgi:hypothetical protein
MYKINISILEQSNAIYHENIFHGSSCYIVDAIETIGRIFKANKYYICILAIEMTINNIITRIASSILL